MYPVFDFAVALPYSRKGSKADRYNLLVELDLDTVNLGTIRIALKHLQRDLVGSSHPPLWEVSEVLTFRSRRVLLAGVLKTRL